MRHTAVLILATPVGGNGSWGCSSDCSGESCDYWQETGWTCAESEEDGCDCSGCACEGVGSSDCVDLPGDISGTKWKDHDNNDCYTYGYMEEYGDYWCADFGDDNYNGEGSANEKCCTCGGGSTGGSSECFDLPGDISGTEWKNDEGNGHNIDGYDCLSYELNGWCAQFGEVYHSEGSANEKCCACGGGSTGTMRNGDLFPLPLSI